MDSQGRLLPTKLESDHIKCQKRSSFFPGGTKLRIKVFMLFGNTRNVSVITCKELNVFSFFSKELEHTCSKYGCYDNSSLLEKVLHVFELFTNRYIYKKVLI
jgi:hypothetical protein